MEDTALATVESPVLEAEFVETPTETAATETAEAAGTDQPGTEVATADGKMPEPIRAALATIQGDAAKQLTSAFYSVAALRKEFPGGLSEARAVKAELAEIKKAGATGEALQELSGFREYDAQFMAGNAKFVDTMVDASPEAFQKIIPHALAKYSEVNPNGWASMVAASVYSDMERVGLPLKMELLSHFLGEVAAADPGNQLVAKAMAQFKEIEGYTKGLREAAVRPVTVAAKEAAPATTNRETELVQELWNSDVGKMVESKYAAEFARIAGGRKISEEARLEIQELFQTRWDQAMKAVPQLQQKVQGFLAANDREGNRRFYGSLIQEHTGRILEALMRRHVSQAPAAKAAPKPAAVAPVVPATSGFTRVTGMPERNTIDFMQTDGDMLRMGKAVLKGGSKVQWR